jgi:hypothetical protein
MREPESQIQDMVILLLLNNISYFNENLYCFVSDLLLLIVEKQVKQREECHDSSIIAILSALFFNVEDQWDDLIKQSPFNIGVIFFSLINYY